jgi:hypothetical protein
MTDFASITNVCLRERPSAIGLGGIAKGYAVDLAMRALRARGVRNALVDASGNLYSEAAASRLSPVLAGDLLFGMSVSKSGHFFCLDANTGQTLWEGPARMGRTDALPVILRRTRLGRPELLPLEGLVMVLSDKRRVLGRFLRARTGSRGPRVPSSARRSGGSGGRRGVAPRRSQLRFRRNYSHAFSTSACHRRRTVDD